MRASIDVVEAILERSPAITSQGFPEARIGTGNAIRVSQNTVFGLTPFHVAVASRAIPWAGDAIAPNTNSAAEGRAISEVGAVLKVDLVEAGEGCSMRVISNSSF
jgi:hypothetical protein